MKGAYTDPPDALLCESPISGESMGAEISSDGPISGAPFRGPALLPAAHLFFEINTTPKNTYNVNEKKNRWGIMQYKT